MRNLRLTEANSPSALLAKTMQNGTNTDGTSKTAIVSNITLEGEITNSTSDLGGLINTVSGGEINTVTSMLKITQNATGSSEYSLGGLIGHIDEANQSGVKIYYCSNYGPITGESKGRAVGGLVGSTSAGRNGSNGNITIDHCFNGSSVLAGYTSGTGYDEQLYYAGGIIGTIHGGNNISIQITNCYNAGIIKAGNKTHTKMSYAAGIVAHSEITDTNKVQISNCYNEGSIEALGADPTTEYVVTGVTYVNGLVSNAEGSKIYLVQTNDKNVSGYHIADIAVTNCAKSDDADLELDGAMLDAVEKDSSGNIITSGDKCNLTTSNGNGPCVYGSDDYGYMHNFEVNSGQEGQHILGEMGKINVEGSSTRWITESGKMGAGGEYHARLTPYGEHTAAIELTFTTKKGETSDFSVLQKNQKNIAEIFVETQNIQVVINMNMYRKYYGSIGSWPATLDTNFTVTYEPTINRNYYYNFSSQISGDNGIITTMENALGASGSASNANLNLDKTSFGSSQRDVAQNYDTTILEFSHRLFYYSHIV